MSMSATPTVAFDLRKARRRRHMTCAEVAARANLDIPAVHMIDRTGQAPADVVPLLRKALNAGPFVDANTPSNRAIERAAKNLREITQAPRG